MKYKLLDLYCCAGGAGMGYHRAGFEITGIDKEPQPRYPFRFIQSDALEYVLAHGHEYDAIHASPPCQKYSWSAKRWNKEWPDLVEPTRDLLDKTGKPYIIENVVGAPLKNYITLCGTMFGLKVIRHRNFEMNWSFNALLHPCSHMGSVSNGDYYTVAGHGGDGKADIEGKRNAMGIEWMNHKELNEAIPPAYTEFIGRYLIKILQG